MLHVAIAGLRQHAVRTLLSCLAITIGVGFFAGTLIYADTARVAFADDFARAARGVDVAVDPPTGAGYDQNSRLDADALARVRAVPGVALAEGRTVARLPVLDATGRALSNNGRPGFAMSLPRSPRLAPFDLVAGRAPVAAGEALLDAQTAAHLGLSVGGHLSVLDPNDLRHPLSVVGIADFGAGRMYDGWSVVGLTDADLATLTAARYFASIVVAGRDGVDPTRLRDDIRHALRRPDATSGGNAGVVTGEALRDSLATDSGKYAGGFADVLLASSIVAMVVAGLVVFNTFTIVLTQRTEELALLRTVGASRRQVFGLVVLESSVAGLLASAVGVGLSLGVAKLIFTGRDLFGAHGANDAGTTLVITPTSVLGGLLLGVLTTVAAACLPALMASRLAPLRALRTAAGPDASSRRPVAVRLAGAGTLAVIGIALAGYGAGAGFDGTVWVLGGAMIVLTGCVVALPLVIVPLTDAVGWLPGRLFGVTAGLAARNARGNPRRVAAATTALMIGATLVSLFAVVFATSRDQAGRELAENFPVDFAVRPVSIGDSPQSLPDALLATLRARAEFSAVVRSQVDLLWTGDAQPISMSALEPGQTAFTPEVMAGSLSGFGPGRVAVRRGYAAAHHLGVGGQVSGFTFHGDRYQATVVALFDDAPIEGELLIDWSDYRRLSGEFGDQVLIRRSAGTSAATARAALDTVLAAYPLTTVTSQAERGESLHDQLQRRLAQFGVLLGISVAIAISGIANTLALSVRERVRETATLRVLGMGRRQLRGMLLVEAVLMAVTGAGLGVCFGAAAGWFAARSLINVYGHGGPSIPVLPLSGFVVLATLAAAAASVLPARRAYRDDLVSALSN